MSTPLKVCFDRILPQDLLRRPRFLRPEDAGPAGAAIVISKLWPNGSTLHVRFLEGNSGQHDAVKQHASEWSEYANLRFKFDNAPDAEIRITFRDDGAWSYIGTDCLSIPQNSATMNYGWLDEGVVLHEFGHAIGLIHEHQNPVGGIKWNKPNVYRDLGGPPNFWSKATVDHNMFDKYAKNQIRGTELDGKSIMLYAIPNSWTLDDFHSDPNDVLSGVDKAFISSAKAYPKAAVKEAVELPVVESAGVQAAIGQPGEEDLFMFTATSAGRYTIETQGQTDVVMSLYGPDSRTAKIAQDDDSGTGTNSQIITDLAKGTYFVQIRHYNTNSGTGSYTIRVMR